MDSNMSVRRHGRPIVSATLRQFVFDTEDKVLVNGRRAASKQHLISFSSFNLSLKLVFEMPPCQTTYCTTSTEYIQGVTCDVCEHCYIWTVCNVHTKVAIRRPEITQRSCDPWTEHPVVLLSAHRYWCTVHSTIPLGNATESCGPNMNILRDSMSTHC